MAAALGIVLIILGSGFGLASVRPWPGAGASAAKFSVMTGIWLIIVQWLASGLGGYLTGRLRTRWLGTHSHEVHFRDTAHGFLTWAVATVMVVLLAAGAASLAAGAHARTAATASAAAAGPYTDEVDALFRSAHPDGGPGSDAARGEAARFLAKASLGTPATADDRSWLAAMVTDRTGIAPADAAAREQPHHAQVEFVVPAQGGSLVALGLGEGGWIKHDEVELLAAVAQQESEAFGVDGRQFRGRR